MKGNKMAKRTRIISIDTETTGLDFENSHIIEIACVPLTSTFEVDTSITPFIRYVNPGREALYDPKSNAAFKINKINREIVEEEGITYSECKHQFIGWLKSFTDACDPMGQNWMFDAGMLLKMFGHDDFEKYFTRKIRDPKIVAQCINDGFVDTFENTSLDRIARFYGVKFEGDAHRAYNDCIVTAKVWRAMHSTVRLRNLKTEDNKETQSNSEGK
jgi:DNA polymerase III epsilon subunit-like protein